MKIRKRPLGKLNRKTGQIHIELALHICYIQKPEDASGKDVRIKLISVSYRSPKLELLSISLENTEMLL